MSAQVKSEEAKYFERLDIAVLGIDKIKNIIKQNIKNTINCWKNGRNIERQTFHIIGPAGVGKTSVCKQMTDELTKETGHDFGFIIIKAPVISRDDLLCPFPEVNNGATKFKMLYSDFIPTKSDSFGLFIIDEFGRGDHQLQQLCWQIMNEQKIHVFNFPAGWFVISLDNPDDSEYSMNYLEDAAGLRRSLHLYSDVSVPDFLTYAIANKFHNYVVEFIQMHPEHLYDFESQKLGRVYSNPASWERVSNILLGYGVDNEIFKNMNDIDYQCSGLLNNTLTRIFTDFMKNKDNEIRPKDIFKNYLKSERQKILNLKKEANNVKIGQIMLSFLTYLSTSKPSFTTQELKNIGSFLLDIPADIAATYFTTVKDIKGRDTAAFDYLTAIQMELMKDEKYKKDFYESMLEMSKRSRSEK